MSFCSECLCYCSTMFAWWKKDFQYVVMASDRPTIKIHRCYLLICCVWGKIIQNGRVVGRFWGGALKPIPKVVSWTLPQKIFVIQRWNLCILVYFWLAEELFQFLEYQSMLSSSHGDKFGFESPNFSWLMPLYKAVIALVVHHITTL